MKITFTLTIERAGTAAPMTAPDAPAPPTLTPPSTAPPTSTLPTPQPTFTNGTYL